MTTPIRVAGTMLYGAILDRLREGPADAVRVVRWLVLLHSPGIDVFGRTDDPWCSQCADPWPCLYAVTVANMLGVRTRGVDKRR